MGGEGGGEGGSGTSAGISNSLKSGLGGRGTSAGASPGPGLGGSGTCTGTRAGVFERARACVWRLGRDSTEATAAFATFASPLLLTVFAWADDFWSAEPLAVFAFELFVPAVTEDFVREGTGFGFSLGCGGAGFGFSFSSTITVFNFSLAWTGTGFSFALVTGLACFDPAVALGGGAGFVPVDLDRADLPVDAATGSVSAISRAGSGGAGALGTSSVGVILKTRRAPPTTRSFRSVGWPPGAPIVPGLIGPLRTPLGGS